MEQDNSNVPTPGSVVSPTTDAEIPGGVKVNPPVVVDPLVIQAVTAAVIAQLKPLAEATAAQTANSVLSDFKSTTFGKKVVGFFDSAIGKSLQTLLWTVGAYLAAILVSKVAGWHYNPQLTALGLPGLINWVAYTVKVFADSHIPNTPGVKN